jgi:hypothetical protein
LGVTDYQGAKRNFSGCEKAPVFSAILRTYLALVEKVWEILKGFGRDSIDRLRRSLYLPWANNAFNRKVNNREGAFRRGTGKVAPQVF